MEEHFRPHPDGAISDGRAMHLNDEQPETLADPTQYRPRKRISGKFRMRRDSKVIFLTTRQVAPAYFLTIRSESGIRKSASLKPILRQTRITGGTSIAIQLTAMERFLTSLLTIGLGLGFGFLIGTLFRRYGSDQSFLSCLRIRVQKICLLGINPIAFIGAVWIVPMDNAALALLPLVGLVALSSGFFFGWLAMRFRPLSTPGQSIGFSISCSFTNIGNIGGLIVFVLLGELAYSSIPFYKLFEEIWYYGILFPYARQQAAAAGLFEDKSRQQHTLLRTVRDPFFLIVALAIALGLTLNLLGFTRPSFYGELNSCLIPSSSFLLLTTVGSQIRVDRISHYWKPAAGILLLRLTVVPPVTIAAALLLGFGGGDPLVIKTISVLMLMPIGFTCLVPAHLYKLDSDLVNTAWIISTSSLIVTVPLLSVLLV